MTIIKAMTFDELRFANVQRNKEWDAGGLLDASYRGNEFAGEAGEVCNKVKKMERERLGLKGSRCTIFQLAAEIADAQICLDLIAMHYSIDVPHIVRLVFNAKSEEHGFLTRL